MSLETKILCSMSLVAAAGFKPVTRRLCVLTGTISRIKVDVVLTLKWQADNMIAGTGDKR